MVKRIYVEKKKGCDVAAAKTKADILGVLGIEVKDVRQFIRYDIEGLEEDIFEKALNTIFSEPPVDNVYIDELPGMEGYKLLVTEYLPGQYDQRADSAMQCVQLLSMRTRPLIKCATVYAFAGAGVGDMDKIKHYLINPVDSREGDMVLPETLVQVTEPNLTVPEVEGFTDFDDEQIAAYHASQGFAMSVEDLKFVRDYFRGEGRVPTFTELKVIDTYWSDHCRHTTFATELTDIKINSDNPHLRIALNEYKKLFKKFNASRADKYVCMMDIATIAVKELKASGKLDNLDVSDEINACSVEVDVDNDGETEKWLIMFKNETHNHPTEIEPFGGAATCLGGAIRDPLSGRTYVYQAMRVTGCADPRESVSATLPGKLPQRVITKTAAAGYSSYGNQIGLATGLVAEMYHPNYKAKRLETGYVIGGNKKENIVRRKPVEGDVIVLLGGDTGRDGCGGATGSSKAHTKTSVETCGAEVQKGNPPTERKIQRLFRNPEVSKLIVKCNDFGAGGVSVAIGELADSLDIFLDKVPKKYDGLSGTELAISESQERMAVVLGKDDVDKFINFAKQENLSATAVAEVKDNGYMRMYYAGRCIVELKREFLNTNGVKQRQKAVVNDNVTEYLKTPSPTAKVYLEGGDVKGAILSEMGRLNVCSTKGLGEMFDSTIGAASVIMPFGGKYQLTPAIAMAAKPPVSGRTDTATVSTYGCSPMLLSSSPFTGAVYSIVTAVSKQIATGVPMETIRLTLQEFFKKLGTDPERWGEPVGALLGALHAQINLGLGAIGGKDSMSGSFENLDVPPTLIAFAMGIGKASKLLTNTFEEGGFTRIYRVPVPRDAAGIPDFPKLVKMYRMITKGIEAGDIQAATVVEEGGAVCAVLKACAGNMLGTTWTAVTPDMFAPAFGDFIVLAKNRTRLRSYNAELIAKLNGTHTMKIAQGGISVKMSEITKAFTSALEGVFPSVAPASGEVKNLICCAAKKSGTAKIARPRVLIPVFPGTNCEYDTARAFERAGAVADTFIIRNQSAADIEESAKELIKAIEQSQIIAFPGGFSGGDEPDGSGKFIATTFRNPAIAEAVMKMLYERDGLALGICNGFQALIKLGLVPFGDIREQTADAPTLTFNNISRHVSTITRIRVATNKSPWLYGVHVDDVFNVPVSHGEGKFVASAEQLQKLIDNGQVATQYVDLQNNATMVSPFNPNGSMMGIEGIISPDGRVLGKMGHSERRDENLYKNVPGNYDMKIFESGVNYFS